MFILNSRDLTVKNIFLVIEWHLHGPNGNSAFGEMGVIHTKKIHLGKARLRRTA